MRYGTIIIDPPWAYERVSGNEKLTGYSAQVYEPLTTDALVELPVGDVAADDAVLLLWTTGPFLPDALRCITAWGFQYVTALYWVKVDEVNATLDGQVEFRPAYGVGYWMRGCAEPILLAKRPGAPSFRQPYVGLLSPSARHSRKPEDIYAFADAFPDPKLEIFARRERSGWRTLGNEVGDRQDIREALPKEGAA
jgi:N6-adenosine-specific RNA methylase IME4